MENEDARKNKRDAPSKTSNAPAQHIVSPPVTLNEPSSPIPLTSVPTQVSSPQHVDGPMLCANHTDTVFYTKELMERKAAADVKVSLAKKSATLRKFDLPNFSVASDKNR